MPTIVTHVAVPLAMGLGLGAAIARLHRARLAFESNEPGLRVVVDLPARG